ncbi:MAG: FeoB-associated Cys-rich membrane protein [Clostridiales bacterium]|nr:FeoB-associated Cys-rich membrane protein [Clostridiales bacterium]
MLTLIVIAIFAAVIFLSLRSMMHASAKDGEAASSGCTGSCTTCSAHCRDILRQKEGLKDRSKA